MVTLDPLDYRTPAIRHLAWMLTAPQLLNDPRCVDFRGCINSSVIATLDDWEQNPGHRPPALRPSAAASASPGLTPHLESHLESHLGSGLASHLSSHPGPSLVDTPPRRLGLYFEELYAVLLSDLLGWSILARNLVVRSGGQTLGELDCVVRNPETGVVEHHEIAVKFYLGVYEHAHDAPLWYGPDTQDRLDIKTDRLLQHQCRMSERPETRRLLDGLGVENVGTENPVQSRAFMPGYLFYPLDTQISSPVTAAARHLRGYWLPISQLCSISTRAWIPLAKPHWIGPWIQTPPPDVQSLEEALSWVETRGYPRLFAAMKPLPDGSGWVEHSRYFVTPEFWPGIRSF